MTYQFKIHLPDSKNPEIWRRVLVPSKYSFLQFHKVIRTAFNKEYSQKLAFAFSPSGKGSTPQITIDIPFSGQPGAKTALLSSIFKYLGQKYTYQPDYFDDWMHQIVLEQIIKDDISDAECFDGEGAYPPETVADYEEYEEMKQILSDKNHPKYQSTHELLELGKNDSWEEAHKFNIFEVKEKMKQIDVELKTFRNYTIAPYNTFDEKYGLTPALWKKIDNIRVQLYKGKNLTDIIGKLEELSRKYPNIPHFKNTLAFAYLQFDKKNTKDKEKRFFEIALSNLENYPDYVMARCTLALHYLVNQPEKALELLGNEFDLSVLYPDRNGQFTEIEIFNYHIAAFRYCALINNDTEAEKHLDFLEYHYIDKIHGSEIETQFLLFRAKRGIDRFTDKQSVEVIPELVEPTEKAPDFEHPEMEILYNEAANIERATLDKILTLPHESLIRDLEKILLDSIARFQYFSDKPDLDIPWACLHALYLLSALEAEEALETVIKVLRQKSDYYEFWYGDKLTEEFWRFIYMTGQNRLDRLKDFILEPNRYTYARTAVSTAIMQIAIHQPARKEEIFKCYEDVLQYMMEHKNDSAIFEKTVYSFVIDDLTKIADKEQFPLVKRFCDETLIDQSIFPLQKVKQKLDKKEPDKERDAIYTSIHQYYHEWQKWFNKNSEKEALKSESLGEVSQSDTFLPSHNEPFVPQIAKPPASQIAEEIAPRESYISSNKTPHIAEPKVGRNEPCSCGSGKKYKKCCGG